MSVAIVAPRAVDYIRTQRNKQLIAVGVVLAVAVPAAGYAAGGANAGSLTAALAISALAVPIIIWRSLRGAVTMVAVMALSIEQFRYDVVGTGFDAPTDRIPVFGSLGQITGMAGLRGSPMDLLLLALLVLWAFRAAATQQWRAPRSRIAVAIGIVATIWTGSFVHGIVTGGDLDAASFELRSFLYLAATYFLTSRLLPDVRGVVAMGWALVVSTGIKAIEGMIILIEVRGLRPAPEAILGHEESFFFGLFITLCAALWLFRIRSRLRLVATLLLPVVLIADIGNTRRVAWLILAADFLVLIAVAWIALPDRRRLITRVVACAVAAFVLYLPFFWNGSGLLAQPARATRSLVDPSVRDSQSDAYRYIEDADLGVNIKSAGLLGTGMGLKIDYSTYKIVDLSPGDSFIQYNPHNGLLWVWMRAGPVGELALWGVVAAVIITGLRLARSRDRATVLVGAIGTCTAVQWVILGYSDMGFWWFRVAIVTGVVFGLVEAARRREVAQTESPSSIKGGSR